MDNFTYYDKIRLASISIYCVWETMADFSLER